MAAFGSFAGLATAGIGALCGYETDALGMFDCNLMVCKRDLPQAESKSFSASTGKINGERQDCSMQAESSNSFETPAYTCSPSVVLVNVALQPGPLPYSPAPLAKTRCKRGSNGRGK